jgi:hypothetical protein
MRSDGQNSRAAFAFRPHIRLSKRRDYVKGAATLCAITFHKRLATLGGDRGQILRSILVVACGEGDCGDAVFLNALGGDWCWSSISSTLSRSHQDAAIQTVAF